MRVWDVIIRWWLCKVNSNVKPDDFPIAGFAATTMSSLTVLPGESVPAQHVNLKLGPGLLQVSGDQPNTSSIISTRAGTVNHSANNSKWWVESNSRRVSGIFFAFNPSFKQCNSTFLPLKSRSLALLRDGVAKVGALI